MSVRKKEQQAIPSHISKDVFEDVVKQSDRIESFTIESISRDINNIENRIVQLESKKTVLEVRKAEALAL